jgi:hypothetical protein
MKTLGPHKQPSQAGDPLPLGMPPLLVLPPLLPLPPPLLLLPPLPPSGLEEAPSVLPPHALAYKARSAHRNPQREAMRIVRADTGAAEASDVPAVHASGAAEIASSHVPS